MAHYTDLSPAALAEACAAFGLPPPDQVQPEPRGRVNTSYHLWAGGERWFLRLAEAAGEEAVRFEAEVQRYLFEARFPVPRLVTTTAGQPFAVVAGKPAMLFAYAPGEELAAAEVDAGRCRRIGEQLGRLHDLSAGFTLERANPYGPETLARWVAELGGAADEEARAALPLFREELAAAAALPGAPRGLCHGDLFADNVLWLGDRVGYLLDWEMACTEAFAWDLAVAVDAWCWVDGAHDHRRAVALLEGYRGRRKLEPETAAALQPYARLQAVRWALGRLRTFPGGRPPGDHVVWKDWRECRDRLLALRAMGPGGYLDLLGLGR